MAKVSIFMKNQRFLKNFFDFSKISTTYPKFPELSNLGDCEGKNRKFEIFKKCQNS